MLQCCTRCTSASVAMYVPFVYYTNKGAYDLTLLPQCDAVWEWGQVCSQMPVCMTMSVYVCVLTLPILLC